jgi:hypothetical protein
MSPSQFQIEVIKSEMMKCDNLGDMLEVASRSLDLKTVKIDSIKKPFVVNQMLQLVVSNNVQLKK